MKTLLKHSVIYTLDRENTVAEALVMEEGKILQVGTEAMLREYYGNEMEEIDCGGRCVLPAFHDSHMHLLGYGLFLEMVDLSGAASIRELQQRMRQFIVKHKVKTGEWIRGRGWNQDEFKERQMPTKEDLDAISKECPIVISRVCGHILVANSKAMEICQITDSSNGIFRENEMDRIYRQIPEPDVETLKRGILRGQKRLLAYGITAVQSDDFGNVRDYKKVIQAYRELEEEGRLQLKIYEQCNLGTLSRLKEFLEDEDTWFGLRNSFRKGSTKFCLKSQFIKENESFYLESQFKKEDNSHRLESQFGKEEKRKVTTGYFRLGSLKIVGDGSLGARTAWLRKPYMDAPDTTGIACYDQEEFYNYIKYAHDNGIPIAVHCIGDAMVEAAVDGFERLQKENPRPDLRHGIVHCQITDDSLLKRIAKQRLLVFMQPIFLNYDLHIAEARVGKELARTSYNWKSLFEYGGLLSMGTDCPVEDLNPMKNIYSAVTRKDLKGYPKQGFYPEQRLSVLEAVKAYTLGSAYAVYQEEWQGSLEIGKYADLVVLDQDIFQCEMMKIKDVSIWKTFVGGKEV